MRQYQGVYPATTDEDILRNVFSIQLIAVQEKQKNDAWVEVKPSSFTKAFYWQNIPSPHYVKSHLFHSTIFHFLTIVFKDEFYTLFM